MKWDFWKPCRNLRWLNELRFSIERLFEQSATQNIYLLCYWPTVHKSILKVCPAFQVLSSHMISEANALAALLDEHWVKIVWRGKIQLQSMSNALMCIYKRFSAKNSGISCLALIFYLSNPRTTIMRMILHAKNRFKVARYDQLYTVFFQTHGLVVKANNSQTGDMASTPESWWYCNTFCPWTFCMALSQTVHCNASCCSLSNSL